MLVTKMTYKQACEKAREHSDSTLERAYVLLFNGKYIVITHSDDADILPNIVAYTWYQVRSKADNKWSIQVVK